MYNVFMRLNEMHVLIGVVYKLVSELKALIHNRGFFMGKKRGK